MPRTACLLASCAALVVAAAVHAAPAAAQSDILLQLRSGSPQGDRLRVDSAGGFVALGTLGVGIIPATGCGERTMWYPFRGAFRTGSPNYASSTCTEWNDANLGFFSIAGGNANQASGYASAAFGEGHLVTGTAASAFGTTNVAAGSNGFTAGSNNRCAGFACVALGNRVHASADYAMALGNRAHAKHNGAFAWGDVSTTDSLRSTANNQFSTRAAGGYRFFTNATLTAGVTMSAGGSTWNAVSDRARKENFAAVNGEDVLLRLRAVPVTSWNYIAEGREVRHVGPMAQDWHAAFGLNDDPLTINQGDFDGVNLAAVKALEARTAALQAHADAQAREIAELRARNEAYERRLAALEAAARGTPPVAAGAPEPDER
jgi:trimeric autotransporter adhesin